MKPNEPVNRRKQLRHTCEDAAPNPLVRDVPEPSHDPVQQPDSLYGKTQLKSWMFL